MTYPYVASFHDKGPAKGPRRAVVWHMAEGGGTVNFLAKPNVHGVSVHFVVEYSGRIVQMLAIEHMHTSIRASDIRTTDDPDGFYGRTAAVAVMGEWADTTQTLGPNHASLAVEVEGFAKDGPNAAQTLAIGRLWDDLHGRFPTIRSLGHRDFADYKACPGKLYPWSFVGGHGPTGDPMQTAQLTYYQVANAKGGKPVYDEDRVTRIHTTPVSPVKSYPLLVTDDAFYLIRLPGNLAGWIAKGDVGSVSMSQTGPIPPLPGPGTITLSLNGEVLYEEILP